MCLSVIVMYYNLMMWNTCKFKTLLLSIIWDKLCL